MTHHHRPERRRFLAALAAGGTGAVIGLPSLPALAGTTATSTSGATGAAAMGPYGPLGEPDASGLRLPEGFTGRVVANAGELVPGTDYQWHAAPDGGATFAADDGGWIYVSNSETGFGDGGVGALRFSPDGEIVDAYRILDGTARNCAGGHTPWSTWLSCEEFDVFGDPGRIERAGGFTAGRVWECDPTQPGQGVARPALGVFVHEAVAVDPDDERLYLTEDHGDGRFYRFTPDPWPSLDEGQLEVMVRHDDDTVSWLPVPDPSAESQPTRLQVPESTAFLGGEGAWYRDGHVYFTTKGDDHVWDLDIEAQRLHIVYDGAEDQPLHNVDNITAPPVEVRDLYVAEDGDNMEVVIITEEGPLVPFLQAVGDLHEGSELCGPAFTDDGSRFYVSSQRGGERGIGMTWEITGPFRSSLPSPTTTTTVLPAVGGESAQPMLVDSSGDGTPAGLAVGAAAGALAALGAAALAIRRRGTGSATKSADG